MKLFYCHIPEGNFGDDLNTYLWPKLLPGAFSGTLQYRPKVSPKIALDGPDPLFVGIGTLIHSELPAGVTKHVFGSGYGYGKLPAKDGSWHYHCVRGPLTAKALGLTADKAIADPAILTRLLHRAPVKKLHRVSFIPHWEMALSGDWEKVCRLLGIHYIDPRWRPARVIGDIHATRTLITEALHGAIVADALRVPWMAVSSHHTILNFKWEDWCQSVDLTYAPTSVPTFWKPRPGLPGKLINGAKQLQAAATLAYLMRAGHPHMSRDAVLENRTERLLDTLAQFSRQNGLAFVPEPAL
ncbi:succinoglycan biosynthesis protein ExoV [Rhizomicrobium palustre]|uniref:Succinoglycan biosynthesis protein ExoV n=1 Tax=Rhizomicrobium palustre TaxID=189966 RepID=A0A846N392_9PROT|nr:polysaccharide pyruvyl transferase family protein [Rhizomicrobium palustre]NIK89945.1 succinoglycan biosynthesis protein ExoV [Rhizomicrobium palustre]